MEEITWIAAFKDFGLPGVLVLILALTLRSIILNNNKRSDLREEGMMTMMRETSEAIRKHTEVMDSINEKLALEKNQIINQINGQIRKSESNIKRHIDLKGEKN